MALVFLPNFLPASTVASSKETVFFLFLFLKTSSRVCRCTIASSLFIGKAPVDLTSSFLVAGCWLFKAWREIEMVLYLLNTVQQQELTGAVMVDEKQLGLQ